MSARQRHLDTIQHSNHVDLPGTRWRHLPQLLLMTALTAVATGILGIQAEPWRRVGYGLLVLLCLTGALHALYLIGSARRAIRIRPDGIADRGGAVIPWQMLAEAESGRDTDDAWDMRVLLILSDEGRDWARNTNVLLKDVHKPLRARGMEMPVLRGCNHQETADVLTVAIRINRQRLGLPPVV